MSMIFLSSTIINFSPLQMSNVLYLTYIDMHPTKKQVYSILIAFSWLLFIPGLFDIVWILHHRIDKNLGVWSIPLLCLHCCIPFYYTRVGSIVYLLCFVKAYRTLHDNGERIVSSLFGSIIHSHDEPFHIRLLLFSYYFLLLM
jgi:hypothetical protein